MKKITFHIYLSEMNDELFSDKIMIDKPKDHITKTFSLAECLNKEIHCVSDLINAIKDTTDNILFMLGDLGMENFCYENTYLQYTGYLFGLQKDKQLLELFEDFSTDELELAYIWAAGGASIHCNGYRFAVYSGEDNHRYSPHVHVIRNDVSVRYSLETFERFQQDNFSREHARDEKKIILPVLKRNKKRLMGYWNLAIKGYSPPVEDECGKQYI